MNRFKSPTTISCRWLASQRNKGAISVLLLFLGVLGASFTVDQYYYSRLMSEGRQAIQDNRFDTQAFAKASKLWFARQDKILFNQGILAYKAGNLSHAAQLFREAAQRAHSDTLRTLATYNVAKVMQDLGEMEGARMLFEETLRHNAGDMEAKFNLEQIQHHLRYHEGGFSQATLSHKFNKPLTSHPLHKPIPRRKGT